MRPNDLIGKVVVRTKPIKMSNGKEDHSYIENPIKILKVTDTHIVVQLRDNFMIGLAKLVDKPLPVCLLGKDWIDDNWIDYDELIKIEKNIDDLTPEDFK